MSTTEKEEQHEANLFMRQCIQHLGAASDAQKNILLKTLLERPPEIINKVELAQAVWNGLSEKEIMQLIAVLQKQFDREWWEFAARWRK